MYIKCPYNVYSTGFASLSNTSIRQRFGLCADRVQTCVVWAWSCRKSFLSKPEGTEIRGTASRAHKSWNRKHGNLVDNPPNQQSYEVTSQICRKHKIIGQSAGKHIKNDQELSLGNIGKFTRSSHQVLHLPCCGLGSLAWCWNR